MVTLGMQRPHTIARDIVHYTLPHGSNTPLAPSSSHSSQLYLLQHGTQTLPALLTILHKPLLEPTPDLCKLLGDRKRGVRSDRLRVQQKVKERVPQLSLPILPQSATSRPLDLRPRLTRLSG
jgi:hypothetical protein